MKVKQHYGSFLLYFLLYKGALLNSTTYPAILYITIVMDMSRDMTSSVFRRTQVNVNECFLLCYYIGHFCKGR